MSIKSLQSPPKSSVSTVAEASREIRDLQNAQHMEEAQQKADTIAKAGKDSKNIATIAGAVIGGIVGTIACPGAGTVAGAMKGGQIGKLAGDMAVSVCNLASNTIENKAQKNYGDGTAMDGASNTSADLVADGESTAKSFEAVREIFATDAEDVEPVTAVAEETLALAE